MPLSWMTKTTVGGDGQVPTVRTAYLCVISYSDRIP